MNLENTNPTSPARTWDFMETAFVGLISYGVYTLAAGFTLTLLLPMLGTKTLSAAQAVAMLGPWYGAAYIVASPLAIAVALDRDPHGP